MVHLRVERSGAARELDVHTGVVKEDGSERGQLAGVWPLVRVGEVKAGSPSQEAGVQSRDGVLRVGPTPIHTFAEIPDLVAAAHGQALAVTFWRDGAAFERAITPRDMGEGPKLGLGPSIVIKKFGILRAVRESVVWTWDMTAKTFEVLKKLLTAQLSPKTLMGPLGMAKASGAAARQSFAQWVSLMAVISLQVGIMNLFPMAPLDGGHLAILAGESLVRRDLSLNAKAWIMNAGALMLFALIGLVLYSDFAKTALFQKIFH
jgi:regulator of sigma E protease